MEYSQWYNIILVTLFKLVFGLFALWGSFTILDKYTNGIDFSEEIDSGNNAAAIFVAAMFISLAYVISSVSGYGNIFEYILSTVVRVTVSLAVMIAGFILFEKKTQLDLIKGLKQKKFSTALLMAGLFFSIALIIGG